MRYKAEAAAQEQRVAARGETAQAGKRTMIFVKGTRMKSPLLALVIGAVSAVPGLAADLPYRKGPPQPYIPPPPIFTWTGLYVGLNAGAIFSNNSRATEVDPSLAGFD